MVPRCMAVQDDSPPRSGAGRAAAPLMVGYWSFGQYWGTWVVVFADFLRAHRLSEGQAGVELGALSIVSIVTMTLVAPRLQSLPLAATIPLALVTMGLGVVLVAYLPTGALLAAFTVLGVGNGLIDVFINVGAQSVEARTRRPALQWLHASYSVGGVTGAVGAGIAHIAGVPYRIPLATTGVLMAAVAAWNLRSPSVRDSPGPRGP